MTGPDEREAASGDDRDVVERYFAAMRRGSDAEHELLSLFAEDAVYVEPFSGEVRRWVGVDEIRAALRAGWETPMPDMTLEVRQIEVTGDGARSAWTCTAEALGGAVDGSDLYEIVDGRITRLEVRIDR